MKPLVFVVGPTGVGKSALGLKAAEKFGGVIFNFDSVQVYRGLNIGAAKPSAEDLQRVPHFLLDVSAPGESLTAGDFQRLVEPLLQEHLPKHPVFGVGGSGFYIQAVDQGMYEAPATPPQVAEQLRSELKTKGAEVLHQELAQKDPPSAARISPNDHYRLIRALAVIRQTGRAWSQVQKEFAENRPSPVFARLKVGLKLAKDELKTRVERRTQRMLEDGFVEEVQDLLKEGYREWPALRSVGYREVVAYLNSQLKREDLVSAITTSTLQLAKKQMTWFKRDPDIQWFDSSEGFAAPLQWIESHLSPS